MTIIFDFLTTMHLYSDIFSPDWIKLNFLQENDESCQILSSYHNNNIKS